MREGQGLSIALAATLLVFPGHALAQSVAPEPAADPARNSQAAPSADATSPDDIIVTANRRSENVQKVAGSISVVTGTALAKAGISKSLELGQGLPNVNIVGEYNTVAPRISIRGVGLADFNANANSPIGIYFDDVYVSSNQGQMFQLFDLQRTEVLRGPQGTLYGRNTTGGAIKFFSNLPTDQFELKATLRVGNYGERAGELVLSGPLAGDVLKARIAVTGEVRDGLTFNRLTDQRNLNNVRNGAARAIFVFEPDPKFRATVNLHGGIANPRGVAYKPRGTIDPLTGAQCGEAAIIARQCGDALGYRETDPDPFSVAKNYVGPEYLRSVGAALTLEKTFDWAKLTSISAYDDIYSNRTEDSDSSPGQILEVNNHSWTKQFSQELRLTSPGGRRFNWIVGGYYFYKDVRFDNFYDAFRSLRPLVGFDPADFVATIRHDATEKDEAIAGFGRVDYAITDRLKISGGLRYTHERETLKLGVALEDQPIEFGPAIAPVPVLSFSGATSANKLTWDAGLNFQLTNNVLAYATIARGFKSGGFNGGVVFDISQVTSFRPETITSYEIGLKVQSPDHRLTFNVAGFYYDYSDLQVFTFVNRSSGVPIEILDNAANARVYGLEAEATAAVTPSLRVGATFGYLKTEFLNFQSALASADFTGHRLANAPAVTASASIDWTRPLTERTKLFANLLASYRSKVYFDSSNRASLSQGGYGLVNARLGVEIGDRNQWSISVWAKNLFDQRYYRSIADGSQFGFELLTIGDPRTFGLEASIQF